MAGSRSDQMYTGLGLVLGSALGMVFGLLLLSEWWIAPLVGTSAGLLIGAAVDAQRAKSPRGPHV